MPGIVRAIVQFFLNFLLVCVCVCCSQLVVGKFDGVLHCLYVDFGGGGSILKDNWHCLGSAFVCKYKG